jgi:hypothetical protein
VAVSTADLVAQTRLASGLRNNRLWSDDQICDALTDGYADLRDRLIVRFAAWFKSEVEFTLSNGEGNNVFDLTTVPDFQMAQGLDLLNNGAPPFTVPMLDSFAERNQYNNLWPLGVGWSFNGYLGRRYWIDGDTLTVYPSQNASGNYRLIYTPMLDRIALPITTTFAIDTGDLPAVPPTGGLAGTGSWALLNSELNDLVPTDGSVDMNLTFTSPPASVAFSGAYPIVSLGLPPTFGRPTMGCSNLASTAGFASPPVGTGTYTYQAIGTIGELPQPLTPWAKYIVLYASLVIRTSRQQQTQDLELQFQQMQARVTAATKQRSEGIRQAPLVRGWGGGFGGGGGWR